MGALKEAPLLAVVAAIWSAVITVGAIAWVQTVLVRIAATRQQAAMLIRTPRLARRYLRFARLIIFAMPPIVFVNRKGRQANLAIKIRLMPLAIQIIIGAANI